ncbi:hypothetical protein [uncultured Alsobacter sp.]|uniref:hypothetical protein n=1 Tax=uncultured Alsobacter sp. TaxID=1748258 RepID=UPI0025D8138B|nr:hypothetical protein [uncultured Alsobacter sp.]
MTPLEKVTIAIETAMLNPPPEAIRGTEKFPYIDRAYVARVAIQALMETAGWQPAETAPKDRKIDVWVKHFRVTDVQWDEFHERWAVYGLDEDNEWGLVAFKWPFDFWMDRPAPPPECSYSF